MVRSNRNNCSRDVGRPSNMSHRLGRRSLRHFQKNQGHTDLSTGSDWTKKLERPRMGMVADLEEEARGGTCSKVVTITDDNKNKMARLDTDASSPYECADTHLPVDCSMIFRVVNQAAAVVNDDDMDFDDDFGTEDGQTHCFDVEQKRRTFYFPTMKRRQSEIAEHANDDEAHSQEILKDAAREEREMVEESKRSQDATRNEREMVDESQITVLDKIEALKKIDKRLLDIERHNKKNWRRGTKKFKKINVYTKLNRKHRAKLAETVRAVRTKGLQHGTKSSKDNIASSSESSSSSSSSSGSSTSDVDTSDSENGEEKQGTSEAQEMFTADNKSDIKDKLRAYLRKAMEKKNMKK